MCGKIYSVKCLIFVNKGEHGYIFDRTGSSNATQHVVYFCARTLFEKGCKYT